MVNENNAYDTLNTLARSGKFPHALIIKDTDIENASKHVLFSVNLMLCNSERERPCGKCADCVKIDKMAHTDISILRPEKENTTIKVDEIRKIREDAYVLSLGGRQKFYILEYADLLTVQAQNAFIKILEEPPKNVIFILICKTVTSLLPTVRSRCQVYSAGSGDYRKENKILETSKNIVDMCVCGDVIGIMRTVEESGSDRNYLKLLLESIIEQIIKRFSERMDSNIKNIVEELWGLLKILNNNVNINLLKGRIMASLIELGGKM